MEKVNWEEKCNDTRTIGVDSSNTITLNACKKADNIPDDLIKQKFVEILNNQRGAKMKRDGGYNSVFFFGENNRYVLRLMKWTVDNELNDIENNKVNNNIKNNELQGLKIQDEVHGVCENYTCNVYEYGIFDIGEKNKGKGFYKGAYAILENCGRELYDYVKYKGLWWNEKKSFQYKINMCKIIIKQVLEALNCLHNQKNYIHCDIKDENIMIQINDDGKIQCKLIDFGFVTQRGSVMNKKNAYRGTPEYMHPSSYLCGKHNKYCSSFEPTIDVWAVGIMIYRMLIGFHINDNHNSGCVNNYYIDYKVEKRCKELSIKPDLIKITDYFKNYVNNQNDLLNDINNYIYLLYIIFYQQDNTIDTILNCNFLKIRNMIKKWNTMIHLKPCVERSI